jgi:hypothetical protein
VQRSNITSLNNQVAFLENQLTKYVVTAPFNGVRVPVVLPEEMLVLYNTDEYIMQIPMKAEDIRYISECKNIFVTDIRNQSRYEATLLEVGSNVEVVGEAGGFSHCFCKIASQCGLHQYRNGDYL